MSFKIRLTELQTGIHIDKLIIQGVDCALYRMVCFINGEEKLVVDDKGKTVTAPNQTDLRRIAHQLNVEDVEFMHQSAFDEMIGHPRSAGNILRTPVSKNHPMN